MSFLLWLAAGSMTQICCFIIKWWKKLIGPCWKLTLSYCSGGFFSPWAFRLLSWLQQKLQSECRCVPFSITEWFSISSVFLHSGLAHMRTKKSFFTVANASENKFCVLPPFSKTNTKADCFFAATPLCTFAFPGKLSVKKGCAFISDNQARLCAGCKHLSKLVEQRACDYSAC